MKLRNIAYAVAVAFVSTLFVLGTAGTGEAKSHKKKAAPEPVPTLCWGIQKPVCATKGPQKQRFTYANACYAAKDGAKVVSQGACKAPKAAKKGKAKPKAAAKAKKPAAKKKM